MWVETGFLDIVYSEAIEYEILGLFYAIKLFKHLRSQGSIHTSVDILCQHLA